MMSKPAAEGGTPTQSLLLLAAFHACCLAFEVRTAASGRACPTPRSIFDPERIDTVGIRP